MRKDLPAFLLGLLATASQILLLREFSAYFSGNELILGIILASWLLGVGLGSLAAGKMKSLPSRLSLSLLVTVLFPCALLAVRFSRFIFHFSPGEIVGPSSAILMSFGACLPVGFPLGLLFVSNVVRQAGDIRRVYVLESAGAVVAGFLTYLLLILFSSSWAAAASLAATAALLSYWAEKDRPSFVWALGTVILLGGFWLADFPSQRMYWKPFELIISRDTRFGRQQIIRTQDQYSLYSNNSPVYSLPDPGAAEDAVHFAMLQNPEARRVLLIGGGLGGTLGELLKYRNAEIDYVELDPETVDLSRRFAGDAEKRDLADDRVHLIFQDGRAFLRRSDKEYQVILVNLPEPATAQVNRFFTFEFFLLAERHLGSDGILSFSVPSSETAIGPELQQFLSSLFFTLSKAFPEVRVVPGNRNIFLASAGPLTLDPQELSRRISALALTTRYLAARSIQSRLHEIRVRYLEDKLTSGPSRLNSDLAPVAFFLSVSHWSAQFRGGGAGLLHFFSGVPISLLLGLPVLLFGLLLLVLRSLKKEAVFSLLPLALMGLTTIVAEIVLLIWYQAVYGFLYGRIALLLATFMLGLFLGGLYRPTLNRLDSRRLAAVQIGFLIVLGVFRLALSVQLPEVVPFVILLVLGILGGSLFVTSNRLYLRFRTDYGRGYGLDLIGSFSGALVTSSLLIPLAGLGRVIDWIIGVNIMGFLFYLARPRPGRPSD